MNKKDLKTLALYSFIVGLFITSGFILSSCEPDTLYIDHYKVGDEVYVDRLAMGCYGVITKYIPVSRYKIKVKCNFRFDDSLSNMEINEVRILGRRIGK